MHYLADISTALEQTMSLIQLNTNVQGHDFNNGSEMSFILGSDITHLQGCYADVG